MGARLRQDNNIDLGYAPEVIRYLTHFTTNNDKRPANLKVISQELHDCIEEALRHPGDKNHQSNQLFLQLNETGDVLRCDWLLTTATKQHAT